MVRSLILALQCLVDPRLGLTGSGAAAGADAPVDPALMPVDLTVVSRPRFAVVTQPATDEIALRQAA